MKYQSTRGRAPILGFEETVLAGLARDGGLYVPTELPHLDAGTLADLRGRSYEDVALRVMLPFTDLDETRLGDMIEAAYAGFGHAARAPLVQIDADQWLLELFHGPTLAFKDFAMQFIGQVFQDAMKRRGDRLTIVGATSGDTGSAAIEAFRGLDNVECFILLPEGRVSEVQRRQMTTPTEPNVHAIAVDGDFDDCQALVKAMFNDHAFRDRVNLTAVNSINWARVLAQSVYYVSSAVALGAPERSVSYTVPTGNFGDIFAGDLARRMGVPIDRLVIATNRNDILHRTMETGEHRKEGVAPTISPSMDIQVSSNFERALFRAYDEDGNAVAQLMEELSSEGGFSISQGAMGALREVYRSGCASEEETAATIRSIYARTGEVLCPHTAVGVKVATEHRGETPMVTLATAHPAKFPDAVEAATGSRPALPPRMADLFERPERITTVPNALDALKTLIEETLF
ncbi:threonine synthase [Palleronia aestuarii]|uniref:Threonine synthase n=1 Tax=Palleronia aestuarii TaxID=568105 RepID=A0A2W7NHG7_9RHOB|nr:threonine synthase [Palleronia aestuarii]PZX19698.1 threonine synthase [Palleronia aestuarii]